LYLKELTVTAEAILLAIRETAEMMRPAIDDVLGVGSKLLMCASFIEVKVPD